MDPVTHGITGALLGKGYFSDRNGRVAIFAATLGAVFPDIDTVADAISRDPLAIIKYHRGITHSFVGLPFFAAILAWLTRWAARRLKIEAPSFGVLTLIYGVGIASHILLDGMTSFGTRMLTPISQQRVAWDLLFIIDLAFTSIVLLPQIIAWIYSDRADSRVRAVKMWILFTLAAIASWVLASGVGYPFHVWVLVVAIFVIGALFFLPALGDWGFRLKRSAWCRGGTYATFVYIALCWTAHHLVMAQVKSFAAANHIEVGAHGRAPASALVAELGRRDSLDQRRLPIALRSPPSSSPTVHIHRRFAARPIHERSVAASRSKNVLGLCALSSNSQLHGRRPAYHRIRRKSLRESQAPQATTVHLRGGV